MLTEQNTRGLGFASSDPLGNTGSKRQTSKKQSSSRRRRTKFSPLEVKADFVNLSFPLLSFSRFQRILKHVSSWLEDEFTWRNIPRKHGQLYDNYAQSVLKVLACWKTIESAGVDPEYEPEWKTTYESDDEIVWEKVAPVGHEGAMGTGYLSIPASALAFLKSQHHVFLFLRSLRKLADCHCTRFDLAIDDYDKSVSYHQVFNAITRGHYARVKRKPHAIWNFGGGFTVSLGSRSSDKYVRFYDKAAETDGEIDAYRWEIEYHGELADYIFQFYCSMPEDPSEFSAYAPQLSGILSRAIEFVDKSKGDRLSRWPRLSWWKDFCSRLGEAIHFRVCRPKPSLERKIRWIDRQVIKSLAMIIDGLGIDHDSDWILGRLREARERYKAEDLAMIRVSLKQMQKPTLQGMLL